MRVRLIRFFSATLVTRDGREWIPAVYGSPRDGGWECWLVFFRRDRASPWTTDRETHQPNLQDAVYWASGLEPTYFRGALARAKPAAQAVLQRQRGWSDAAKRRERERYRVDGPKIRARLIAFERSRFPVVIADAP